MKSPEDYLILANLENRPGKGKFIIFFGMSPGVGKTFTMLKEAHRLIQEGYKVLSGIVETHQRKETEELLRGIERIPKQKIFYRGKEWEELDTEAILKAKPDYVLIDELAHSNIPGSLHSKRYQDVFEILNAGINVLSTLNVQHLESLVDSVVQTVKTAVNETVPDKIIERADELVLIDIIPDELIKRLKEGKVYLPEKIQLASEHFFQKQNLAFLRELSLNYMAKFVEKRLPQGKERILVAISPSPHSKNLLRYAKRMSLERNGEIFAIFSGISEDLTIPQQKILRDHAQLAKELGIEIIHRYEEDPVTGIINAGREKKINRIILGQSTRDKKKLFFQKNIVQELLTKAPEFEYTLIPVAQIENENPWDWRALYPSSSLNSYIYVLLLITMVTFFNLSIFHRVGYWPISLIYLFLIAFFGIFFTRGPILLGSLVCALMWNYLFIPPRFTFYIDKLDDFLMFFLFLVIALVNGHLTSKLKRNQIKLSQRETRLSNLYELTANLSKSIGIARILEIGSMFLNRTFPFSIQIFLKKNQDHFTEIKDPKKLALASWVFRQAQPAGRFTNTLPLSEVTFYPLQSQNEVLGVIQIETKEQMSVEQEILFNTISNQIAIAIERENLIEETKKSFLLKESEKLYNLLFSSLSHELKSPLTTIRGSASALLDEDIFNNPTSRKKLLEEILNSSTILNLLVGNLLDISRLESGKLTLKKDLVSPVDLVNESLSYLGKEKEKKTILVVIEKNSPSISIDRSLFSQALFNLIYNSCLYTTIGSKIEIHVKNETNKNSLLFRIQDNGPGLPKENPNLVFQKFFRGEATGQVGTGLGLTIAKAIFEMHGATIEADNLQTGGACFQIHFPLSI